MDYMEKKRKKAPIQTNDAASTNDHVDRSNLQ